MPGTLLLLILLFIPLDWPIDWPIDGPIDGPPGDWQDPGGVRPLTAEDFARLSRELSESGGYFDTDNLISNESSYLHVQGKMREMGVKGGAFIGVGPDQSFSYIAQIRPEIAFMVDIRRDNLLQHLFYKALFNLAENRIDFLCLLFGRPAPAGSTDWRTRSIRELADHIARQPGRNELHRQQQARIRQYLNGIGFGLSGEELAKIAEIHDEFFANGIELRFTSHNRAPRSYYPTYRDLILEKDLTGREASFLASEESFQFLKSLEARHLVIPVVGNLAGEKALKSIGRFLRERKLVVSALYTSNVEYYLMRGDDFTRYGQNVSSLPRNERSVLIRSYFGNSWGGTHPMAVPGYYSTQLLQTLESFAAEFGAGGYRGYGDVVRKGLLDLRPAKN
jgi:hypothetical protein